MDPLTIILIAIAVIVTFFLILVEDAFDKLGDVFFRAIGMQSGAGPLDANAASSDELVMLSLQNRGRHPIKIAAVEGRSPSGGRCFPLAFADPSDVGRVDEESARKVLARISIDAGASRTLVIEEAELARLECQSLAVLDTDGKAWPVSGYGSS